MRVLWFTNIPMPAAARRTGKPIVGSGHWMSVLLRALADEPGISLGVATAYPGYPDLDFIEDGVRYFVAGQPRFQSQLGHAQDDLRRCRTFADRFGPDLIHVHGSERFFGLLAARGLVSVPVVVSMQGLIGAYVPSFFGALSALDIARIVNLRELATCRGLAWEYVEFLRGARQEREVLRGPIAFLGRTQWDRAQARMMNPQARYFHVDELLRPEFGRERWNVATCRRHSILFTNAGSPRRGTETLLDAAAMLAERTPGLEVRLAGSISERTGYGAFLHRRIRKAAWREVMLLGFLDAAALARELASAHVFVIASFVENSPNSLCEAMRVGVPCVAAYTGGIPSLVEDGRTGLLFPAGDAAQLAAHIETLFHDDTRASRLGSAAREVAMLRHDPATVVAQLVGAYEAVSGTAAEPGRRRQAP